MKYIALALILFGFLALQASAQSILKDGKIPKDLVITYESIGRFCHYELKIKSDRKLSLNSFSCLPLSESDVARYESGKKYKKLPKDKLKELISEFERVNFFNLNDEYSTRKSSCTSFITDSGSTKISIQINGKTKQIFFENGCGNEKDKTITQLINLGAKITQIQSEVKVKKAKEITSQI